MMAHRYRKESNTEKRLFIVIVLMLWARGQSFQGSEFVQSMGWQRIQLSIQRQNESNLVTLSTGGPMVYKSEFKIDEPHLRELISQVIRLTMPGKEEGRSGDPAPSPASVTGLRLKSIGEQIFSRLLPQEETRIQLRDASLTDLSLQLDE